MWKCMRCEKENQNTAENCIGCGHGRTMEYLQHRTLTKLPWSLAAHWKISNRKDAEEFLQNKLVYLSDSVKSEKEKIMDKQKELDELNRTMREHDKIIEKKEKSDKAWGSVESFFSIVYYLGGGLDFLYLLYEWEIVGAEINGIVLAVSIIFAITLEENVNMASYIVEGIRGIVSDKKLKQISAERDNVQHSIDEKTEELAAVQSELNSLEQKIQRIEENRETIINKLSQVSPRRMEEAWRRQSLG